MAQTVLTVVGYAVGSYFGYPQLGAAVGSYLGAQVEIANTKIDGARIQDLKVASYEYGAAVPRLWGRARFPSSPIWMSDKREIASTTGGKGGATPEQTTYTYECDILYLVCDNPIKSVTRIWANGELIYTALAESDSRSLGASLVTDKWTDIRIYDGNATQQPDPVYEAAVGVGSAPAYRGRGTVFIEGLQLGSIGQIPVLTFEVVTEATSSQRWVETAVNPFHEWVVEADAAPFWDIGAQPTARLFGSSGDGSSPERSLKTIVKAQGTKRYFEARIDTSGTSSSTNTAWLVAEDHAGNRFGVAYSGHYTTDGTVFDEPYPAASALLWTGGSLVLSFAYDFDTGKLWVRRNGGVWRGPDNLTTDPVTQANGIAHGLSGQDMILRLFCDASIPALSFELFTSEDQFIYEMPDGYIPWSSDAGLATVWTPQDLDLADVVSDLCEDSGLSSSQIDVTDLVGVSVTGVPITRASAARATLQALATAYYFECVETDKLYFVRRGGPVAQSFTADDLVAEDATEDLVGLQRANDLEVPVNHSVQFINLSADFQAGSVFSDRLVSESVETNLVTVPVVLTPARAQGLVDSIALDTRVAATTLKPTIDTLQPGIQPTDVISLVDESGITYRARILRESYADGQRSMECVLDDAAALSTSGVTASNTPGITISLRPTTILLILDIPILRDADDGPGYYAAMKPLSTPWPGASLFTSEDDTTYTTVGAVANSATFGVATSTLADWTGGNLFDEVSTVTVSVGNGTLASTTRNDMLTSDINAAVIGDEVVQFRTATFVSSGIYRLSGLLRGRRGTEWATGTHATGEKFALLGTAGTLRVVTSLAQIGSTIYHKPVTIGRSLASTAEAEHVNESVGLKPFAPSDGRIARDTANDITISWKRRSRYIGRLLAAGIDAPLGEASESYAIDIYDQESPGELVRTITSTTPSCTYSAAEQTADGVTPGSAIKAIIYQVSASVGRGYGLEVIA